MMYLDMAIEALQNLDRGNRVVQRIVDYLSHLAVACSNLRESRQILPPKAKATYLAWDKLTVLWRPSCQ